MQPANGAVFNLFNIPSFETRTSFKWSVILMRVLDGENFFLGRTIPRKKVINESLMTNRKVFSSGENAGC